MASSSSPEERELALVGKVELRIGLADSDSKLETILQTYLAPLLLKLASEHRRVRDKVISVCQHINVRVKPRSIKLPVGALLKQFKENVSVQLIRHFDILYIQQGIGRLSVPEQLALLPILTNGISAHASGPAAHGPQVFHLLLRVLTHFTVPPRGSKEDVELRPVLGLAEPDGQFLSLWFGKLLFLTVTKGQAPSPTTGRSGLSAKDFDFLTLNGRPAEAWDPGSETGLNLTECKITVINMTASGAFTDDERFLPGLVASSDSNSRISSVGDDIMKRILPSIDLESRDTVGKLYGLYFGRADAGGPWPARTPLRIKILSVLSKSKLSTTYVSEIFQLVDTGLTAGGTEDGTKPSTGGSGRESSKLRSAIFSYVHFLTRNGTAKDLETLAPKIINRLKDFVEAQGWPASDGTQDTSQRGNAYEILGLLASKLPPNVDMLSWLFRSLSEDPSGKDVSVSIEEALSTIMGSFARHMDRSTENDVRELLLRQMQLVPPQPEFTQSSLQPSTPHVVRSTRYVAVRFANRCLPYSDVAARWIDILAIGGAPGDTQEVAEEGRRGLDPNWYRMNTSHLRQQGLPQGESSESFAFPEFSRLPVYLFSQSPGALSDLEFRNTNNLVATFKREHLKCFYPAVKFMRHILLHQALTSQGRIMDVDADWARKLETLASQDTSTRQTLKEFIARQTSSTENEASLSFRLFFRSCFEGLLGEIPGDAGDLGDYFVELCALVPSEFLLASGITQKFTSLEPAILSNNHRTRKVAAHAFGLLASHVSTSGDSVHASVASMMERCEGWKTAIGGEVNKINGAILSLGYLFSRLRYRQREDLELGADLKKLTEIIFDILRSSSGTGFREGVFGAINQLCLSFALRPDQVEEHLPFKDLVDQVAKVASDRSEEAIIALGRLAMTAEETEDNDTSSNIRHVEEKLYKLSDVREVETHFSVGEALTCLACGWDSEALATQMDVDAPVPKGPTRERVLSRVIEKVLESCKTTKPSLKRASVVWLLCLVQFCGHRQEIQDRLAHCQVAFKHCLSDREDIVQETASRGLGLLYEKGSRQVRDDLVRDLVSSFSGDKAQLAGNVSDETQLFEPGALPTGDGSVTTYKDILNLASEVGDSSLVYRFMSLAANNSIWTSRAAFGRFGLSNVFADSSVDGLLAQNPKLYPKLYRYRFDPNQNVQRSMNDIWNALVKDSSTTIKTHFDAIMEDLLQNIVAKEWRVRQACCAAIADLVLGRELSHYEGYLGEIWRVAFLVMDDIKGSVRRAAASLARTLTNILTRSLESGEASTKTAGAMLKHILPFLLSTSGLESSAADVQSFALRTLLKIIKTANVSVLRPRTPELIERITSMLSALEPQEVNYLHMNASKYNLTEQKIDDMRLSSIRTSPLMEAIERCLDMLDESAMEELCPRLENVMKTAVGLPSRVGCSRILVSLSTRRAFIFRPHADYFLKLIEKHVMDRNETVSSSYAASAGYVARGATDSQILKMVDYCKRTYFDSAEDRQRLIAGDMIHALSKHSTDRFTSMSADILPFVFVAKHDSHEQVREQFQNTWNEHVGGSRAVMLYLKEISSLAQAHLDSPRWVLKHTASRAIAQATIAASSNVHLSAAQAEILWPPLVRAIGGKTWDGKEVTLVAFAKFVESGGEFWRNRKDVADEINKIVIREARRQNKTYRPFAIRALGQVAAARTDVDMSETVIGVVRPIIDELASEEDKMDVDGEDDSKTRGDAKDSLLAKVVGSVFDSLNSASAKSAGFPSRLNSVLELSLAASKDPSSSVYSATADALKSFLSKGDVVRPETLEQDAGNAEEKLLSLLFSPHTPGFSEALRLKNAQAISALSSSAWVKQVSETLRVKIGDRLSAEKSAIVRQELEKAKQACQQG